MSRMFKQSKNLKRKDNLENIYSNIIVDRLYPMVEFNI